MRKKRNKRRRSSFQYFLSLPRISGRLTLLRLAGAAPLIPISVGSISVCPNNGMAASIDPDLFSLSLSVRLCVSVSLCVSVCLSLSLCLCLSVCLSVCLPVCLSVCLSLSLSKLQSLENKVFEFESESSRSLKVFSLILLFLYVYYY